MKGLQLRSPKLAFFLTFLTGPLGFFCVSWRTGVMSCIAFAVASTIWVGLNWAILVGWPSKEMPTLEISVASTFSLLFVILYTLLQQTILSGWCALLVCARNNSIWKNEESVFLQFQDAKYCLSSVAFIFGFILIVPWALNDILLGIMCLIHASFFWGVVFLLMPHALVAGICYSAVLAIVRALIPSKPGVDMG